MPKMSGAQFMADALHAYGVTHIFFVPTILSHSLAQMDERGTGIARVLTHGEKAAAYMADGYARASGRPGVLHGADRGRREPGGGASRRPPGLRAHDRLHGRHDAADTLPERLPGNRRHQRVRPGHQVQRHGGYCRALSRSAAPGLPRRHLGHARPGAPALRREPGPGGAGRGRSRTHRRGELQTGPRLPARTRAREH